MSFLFPHSLAQLDDDDAMGETEEDSSLSRVPKARDFVCEECGGSFDQLRALFSHQTRDHQQRDRRQTYICSVCDRSYRSRQGLAYHNDKYHSHDSHSTTNNNSSSSSSSSHSGVKQCKCFVCNKLFDSRGMLMKHKWSQHKEAMMKSGKKAKIGSDHNVISSTNSISSGNCNRTFTSMGNGAIGMTDPSNLSNGSRSAGGSKRFQKGTYCHFPHPREHESGDEHATSSCDDEYVLPDRSVDNTKRPGTNAAINVQWDPLEAPHLIEDLNDHSIRENQDNSFSRDSYKLDIQIDELPVLSNLLSGREVSRGATSRSEVEVITIEDDPPVPQSASCSQIKQEIPNGGEEDRIESYLVQISEVKKAETDLRSRLRLIAVDKKQVALNKATILHDKKVLLATCKGRANGADEWTERRLAECAAQASELERTEKELKLALGSAELKRKQLELNIEKIEEIRVIRNSAV